MSTQIKLGLEHCYVSSAEAIALLGGECETQNGGRRLDPKAQIVGTFIKQIRPPDYIPTPAEARAQFTRMVELLDLPGPQIRRKESLTVPGPAGPLPARLYRDSTEDSTPLLLYFHGGGWVQGDLDTHDGLCSRLAAWSGATVLALDYRLAPEHKFPAAVDDCMAAYSWARQVTEFGWDPTRVGLAGDSAGGNLAAVVTQQSEAVGLAPPNFQILVYPALSFKTDETSPVMEDAYILPRPRLAWYFEQYLSDPPEVDDARASPELAADLGALAPTLIVTCGFDPLRDEGKRYADRLTNAGADVVYHEYPGQIHAFLSLARAIPQGLQCQREMATYIRQQFALHEV